jgi:hypothetical protein
LKLLILVISFFISFQTLAATELHTLTFNEPTLTLKKIVIRKPMQTNLIRLYQRMPSEMRMIAGYKEVRTTENKLCWLEGLRHRLKPTNGQMRL